MRRIRYAEIAEELRARVRSVPSGSVLPSEKDLSAEFGVSRVTIRRALDVVREEGLIAARQGFGWFVATEPVRQHLGALGTIEAQLANSGKRNERRVVEFGFVPPPPRVQVLLGGDTVLRVRRLNLADDEPFAVVTVWCPADLGAGLSLDDVAGRSFYELLSVTFAGASQTIGADGADAADAVLLQVPIGAPVLKCLRITSDDTGRTVLVAEHVFPAHRTEFVVELPRDDVAIPSTTPAGLRLVE